jgi:hypothetical protein
MRNPNAIFALKMFDILLLTAYYFIIAFFSATTIDKFLGKHEDSNDENKSTARLFIEAILHTFLLLVVYYIARNIVEFIPFPLDGLYGFQHSRVKERGGDVVFVFIIFFYQDYYVKKLQLLYTRLMKSDESPSSSSSFSV